MHSLMALSVIPVTLAALGFAGNAYAQKADPQKAAQEVAAKYEQLYNKNDAAGVAAMFTEDSIFLPPNGAPPIKGRAAIQKAIDGRMKAGWNKEDIKVGEAHASGSDILSIGEYVLMNGEKKAAGRWADVLTASSDGEWRIKLLAGNSTVARPAGPAVGSSTAPAK